MSEVFWYAGFMHNKICDTRDAIKYPSCMLAIKFRVHTIINKGLNLMAFQNTTIPTFQ